MPTIGCYCRVSTEDQSLQRQLEATREYARANWDVERGDIRGYDDKSTGTDTDRSAYHDLLADVDAGELDAVVANSVSRISRSIRDLDKTVEEIVDSNGTELHIIDEGFTLKPGTDDPYQTAMLRLLGVFAELEAELAQKRTREGIQTRMNEPEYHHGPAPLGFDKDDGYLIESANYDAVRATLQLVADDEISKRKAARELDTSRRTINRALDRGELYSLP